MYFYANAKTTKVECMHTQMDGWIDGQTDRNCQVIAVTLCLCFVARVKNSIHLQSKVCINRNV